MDDDVRHLQLLHRRPHLRVGHVQADTRTAALEGQPLEGLHRPERIAERRAVIADANGVGWPKRRPAQLGLWRRARRSSETDLPVLVLSPADQLMHVCLHGLRWSPVHAGHWVADAVRIIAHAGDDLDWGIVVEEARGRGMALQMYVALRLLEQMEAGRAPADVLLALGAEPVSLRERLECRLKARPVVGLGGMFVIWCAWRRLAQRWPARPSWLRYLAGNVAVESRWELAPWAARHAVARAGALLRRGPRRGASSRKHLADRSPA